MNPEQPSPVDVETSGLDAITGVVGDMMTGVTIPEPIQRNALKALGRLCTALVDIPVATLEGIAAERRAEAQARAKIIVATADQLAAQVTVDPAFAQAAATRYSARIVRQQVNLNRVAAVAINEVKAAGTSNDNKQHHHAPASADELDEDWLNAFETEASEKSSEQMQMLFGKILAGEIRRPKSFSIKTLRLISQLDAAAAQTFKRLCSLAVSLTLPDGRLLDVRVAALGGNAASNALQPHGLSFDHLNVLHEYGLVISDFNSYMDYRMCIAHENQVALGMGFQKATWGLVPKTDRPQNQDFRIHGVALTRAGRELFPIVDIEPDASYSNSLQEFFGKSGLAMQPIAGAT